MKAEYLSRLPEAVRQLALRIEASSGREIGVEINPALPDPSLANPDHLAVRIAATEATILIRNPDDFPVDGVLHELLHVERFWVERVPRLGPFFGSGYITMIDNALEHLVIVPRMQSFGIDPFPYWDATFKHLFVERWNREWTAEVKRNNGLIGWLSIRGLARSPHVVSIARTLLLSEGLLDEVDSFADAVLARRDDKRAVIQVVTRELGLSPFDVRIEVLDPRSGSAEPVELWNL